MEEPSKGSISLSEQSIDATYIHKIVQDVDWRSAICVLCCEPEEGWRDMTTVTTGQS